MPRRSAFALLSLAAFALTVFSPKCVLAQESPAAEGAAKASKTHCDLYSTCVQKVLYFSNVSQPTDLQDVVNAIRAIGDVQRVQQILTGSMVIVEGTPEQVALAEKLATAIDQGKRRFGGLGYRIDLKIQESQGDKKLHSRLYSFLTEAHQGASASIKRRVPVPAPQEPASEAKSASETKPPADPGPSRNIECRILIENERTLELSVEAEFASDPASDLSSAASPQHRVRENVTVELDKPTVISRIDDPDGDRTFTIEVTATRIRDKS